MANTIKLKRASGSNPSASDLAAGELAIRTSNCKLFSKNDSGSAVGIVAGSADTLTTARTIAGVSFDGSANISLNNNAITNGAGFLADIVSDTSPQLGGNLDVQARKLTTSTSNGNIQVEPDGTGVFEVRGAGGNDGTLQLNCSAQSHGIKLKSPAHSAGASYTLTFPDDIVNGQFLTTDANGNLSWQSATNISNNNQLTNGAGYITTVADTTIAPSEIDMEDNEKIKLGTGDDLQIYHNGTDNFFFSGNGDFRFNNGSADLAKITQGGDIELVDNGKFIAGTGNDLEIFHTGGQTEINNVTGGLIIKDTGGFMRIRSDGLKIQSTSNEDYIIANANGAVQIYYDNSKKLETQGDGVLITGKIQTTGHSYQDDNLKHYFGSSQDLEIYHDGSNSYIKDAGTGSLLIRGSTVSIQSTAGEAMIEGVADGAVTIKHNNSTKFQTTGYGIGITGNATSSVSSLSDGSNITVDLSSASHFTVTLGGNRTFINSGMSTSNAIGSSGSIFIVQDGTGSRTAAFQSAYKFVGGTAPTLSTAANAVDRIDYIVRSADNVQCAISLDVK